jgi:hypothetical protein
MNEAKLCSFVGISEALKGISAGLVVLEVMVRIATSTIHDGTAK